MSHRLKVLLLLGLLAAPAGSTWAVSIPADGDVFVYQGVPALNTNSGFFGNFLPVGLTSTGHNTRSLLKFTLPGGLTAAQVQSASLDLILGDTTASGFGGNPGPGAGQAVNVVVSPLLGDWDASTVSWSGGAGPPPTLAIPANGASVSSLTFTGFNQPASFDVTNLVKDWLNGTISNFGVVLDGTAVVGASPAFRFATFASQETANDPLLVINVVPEPSTVLLAGLGLACTLAAAAHRRLRTRR